MEPSTCSTEGQDLAEPDTCDAKAACLDIAHTCGEGAAILFRFFERCNLRREGTDDLFDKGNSGSDENARRD